MCILKVVGESGPYPLTFPAGGHAFSTDVQCPYANTVTLELTVKRQHQKLFTVCKEIGGWEFFENLICRLHKKTQKLQFANAENTHSCYGCTARVHYHKIWFSKIAMQDFMVWNVFSLHDFTLIYLYRSKNSLLSYECTRLLWSPGRFCSILSLTEAWLIHDMGLLLPQPLPILAFKKYLLCQTLGLESWAALMTAAGGMLDIG